CALPISDLTTTGTDAAGAPFVKGWKKLVSGYGVTQFYGGATSAMSGKIIGGAQDNGTVCFDPAAGADGWKTIFGGDGGWCAADPTDPKVFYGEYVFLNLHRNTDGGTSSDTAGNRYISGQFWNAAARQWDWKPVPFRIPDAMTRNALFIAPFVLDPNEPQRILAGGLSLWRTNDAKAPNTPTSGPRWRAIKPSAGSEISAIAVAQGDSDVVWVGHRNGAVFRSRDATSPTPTWDRVGAAGPGQLAPRRYCTHITIDPADVDTVYVSFGGYESDNIWVTRNGGTTWAGPTSVLPPAPVRAITVHPRRHELLYLGTEIGLFASEDKGASWFPTNEGPANCSVDDLLWMDETLVCVTHGRGMFRIDVSGV
ncbi:MAG: WD40/YVTN/BNR-like repeat-containing protein, partial [Pseudonocardia sp.]